MQQALPGQAEVLLTLRSGVRTYSNSITRNQFDVLPRILVSNLIRDGKDHIYSILLPHQCVVQFNCQSTKIIDIFKHVLSSIAISHKPEPVVRDDIKRHKVRIAFQMFVNHCSEIEQTISSIIVSIRFSDSLPEFH